MLQSFKDAIAILVMAIDGQQGFLMEDPALNSVLKPIRYQVIIAKTIKD